MEDTLRGYRPDCGWSVTATKRRLEGRAGWWRRAGRDRCEICLCSVGRNGQPRAMTAKRQADAFWRVREIQEARLSPSPTSGLIPQETCWDSAHIFLGISTSLVCSLFTKALSLSQECPEGWDSSDLIRGLRQKKQSKVWMARSPAVLQNRLLWSLPTTPARSPARPCSPSSTSPPTGATLAHFTTRLRGSGRCTHRARALLHENRAGQEPGKPLALKDVAEWGPLPPGITVGHSPWTSVSTAVKCDDWARCSSKPPFKLAHDCD